MTYQDLLDRNKLEAGGCIWNVTTVEQIQ